MTDNLIVLPGLARFDLQTLRPVAEEFGWDVKTVHDLSSATAEVDSGTAAVLFHCSALGTSTWVEAVRALKALLPETRLVACHGFSEPVEWPALCDAGAFHALWLPLKENEVRKSFGFVLQDRQRLENEALPSALPSVRSREVNRALPIKPAMLRASLAS
jgi:DNA-binding NtrC family response regulator